MNINLLIPVETNETTLREEILTPTELTRTAGGTNLDDLMRIIMEGNNRTTEMFQRMKEETREQRREDSEKLDKKFELINENFKKQEEKID